MGNVTTLNDNIDFADTMTVSQVAQLLHCSTETVRLLTERSWHPLPYINVGMRTRRQRLFRRSTVSGWFAEEERASDPIPAKSAPGKERRAKAG